jgi:hypothetical protein
VLGTVCSFKKYSLVTAFKHYIIKYFVCFFLQASVVLGQFLVLKKNKELFQDWMKDVCGANTKQSSDCYQCLSDWCDEFL